MQHWIPQDVGPKERSITNGDGTALDLVLPIGLARSDYLLLKPQPSQFTEFVMNTCRNSASFRAPTGCAQLDPPTRRCAHWPSQHSLFTKVRLTMLHSNTESSLRRHRCNCLGPGSRGGDAGCNAAANSNCTARGDSVPFRSRFHSHQGSTSDRP